MPEYVKPKPLRIDYVDENQDLKIAYVEPREIPSVTKPSEAQKMAESIVGFCSGCKAQVQMTFPGGFDTKDLDRALHGTPVKSWCPRCNRLTEFLPAAKYMNHPLVMKNQTLRLS